MTVAIVKQHHRQQRPLGIKQEEGIFDCFWIGEDQCALSQIVEGQRRQNDDKPGKTDWRPAKVAKIGVKRLRTGDNEKDGTKCEESNAC
jgi:hypothetical protein